MTSIAGQPKIIKRLNEDLIRQLIKEKGPITKPEIAKRTHLSLTTVNKVVEKLYKSGIVTVVGKVNSTGGRKATAYKLNGDLGAVLGLYYYQDKFICFVSNMMREVKYKENIAVESADHQENILTFLFSCIDRLIQHSPNKNIVAAGIGLPGVVKQGTISNIPKFTSLEGINLKQLIEEKYGFKAFIENDVNITTLGLYHEKYKKITSNMFFIYIGDGIGSGLIINKELYLGFSNFAGEISYLTVGTQENNLSPDVPFSGELEAVLSHIHLLFQDVHHQELAMRTLNSMVIKTLTNIICVINPEVLVINCTYIDDQRLSAIEQELTSLFGSENLPQLDIFQMQEATNINGIIYMCLREINTGYSILRGKED